MHRHIYLASASRKHPVHKKDVSGLEKDATTEDREQTKQDVGAVTSGQSGTATDEGMFAESSWDGWRHVRGEVSLWRAVITQALMDARSESKKRENLYHRQQARVWLEGRSDDFVTVCDYAQMSPELVRELAAVAIAEHDANQQRQLRINALKQACEGLTSQPQEWV